MIKIFDSAAHPTISGSWKTKSKILISSFLDLQKQMKKNKVYRACAIGLDNFEKYNHLKFINTCQKYKNLTPVAGLNPSIRNIEKEIIYLKKIGYKIIKIHPRISKVNLLSKKFESCLRCIEKHDLKLMLCTYPFAEIGNNQKLDFMSILYKIFSRIKKLKIILLHGGSVKLLEFAEFVRNNPKNFLLDLSMTMQKYRGSSLDKDINFLFKNFDEKICIGSDYPEFNISKLRKDFIFYSKNINKKKKTKHSL